MTATVTPPNPAPPATPPATFGSRIAGMGTAMKGGFDATKNWFGKTAKSLGPVGGIVTVVGVNQAATGAVQLSGGDTREGAENIGGGIGGTATALGLNKLVVMGAKFASHYAPKAATALTPWYVKWPAMGVGALLTIGEYKVGEWGGKQFSHFFTESEKEALKNLENYFGSPELAQAYFTLTHDKGAEKARFEDTPELRGAVKATIKSMHTDNIADRNAAYARMYDNFKATGFKGIQGKVMAVFMREEEFLRGVHEPVNDKTMRRYQDKGEAESKNLAATRALQAFAGAAKNDAYLEIMGSDPGPGLINPNLNTPALRAEVKKLVDKHYLPALLGNPATIESTRAQLANTYLATNTPDAYAAGYALDVLLRAHQRATAQTNKETLEPLTTREAYLAWNEYNAVISRDPAAWRAANPEPAATPTEPETTVAAPAAARAAAATAAGASASGANKPSPISAVGDAIKDAAKDAAGFIKTTFTPDNKDTSSPAGAAGASGRTGSRYPHIDSDVQVALEVLEYSTGDSNSLKFGRGEAVMDERKGPMTDAAIIAFKQANGITPANADLNPEIIAKIKQAAADKKQGSNAPAQVQAQAPALPAAIPAIATEQDLRLKLQPIIATLSGDNTPVQLFNDPRAQHYIEEGLSKEVMASDIKVSYAGDVKKLLIEAGTDSDKAEAVAASFKVGPNGEIMSDFLRALGDEDGKVDTKIDALLKNKDALKDIAGAINNGSIRVASSTPKPVPTPPGAAVNPRVII